MFMIFGLVDGGFLMTINCAPAESLPEASPAAPANAPAAPWRQMTPSVAGAVATGSSPQAVIDEVRGQLTNLLLLSECRSQDGAAGMGHPPRLLRTGHVVTGGRVWNAEREGLRPGTHTELLAEAGDLLQGRFLLTPGPRTQLTLEQRLVAVALADQAAAALASDRLASRR
jgi:hypothetical protein